jgi:hypothetical protein
MISAEVKGFGQSDYASGGGGRKYTKVHVWGERRTSWRPSLVLERAPEKSLSDLRYDHRG